MHAHGCKAPITVPSREFRCVEDIGEFGLAVALPATEGAEILHGLEVFEDDAAFWMPAETQAGEDDDAGVCVGESVGGAEEGGEEIFD